jgi:hypothetical protein
VAQYSFDLRIFCIIITLRNVLFWCLLRSALPTTATVAGRTVQYIVGIILCFCLNRRYDNTFVGFVIANKTPDGPRQTRSGCRFLFLPPSKPTKAWRAADGNTLVTLEGAISNRFGCISRCLEKCIHHAYESKKKHCLHQLTAVVGQVVSWHLQWRCPKICGKLSTSGHHRRSTCYCSSYMAKKLWVAKIERIRN